MELYIANFTKKNQKFMYRMPEDARPTPLWIYIRPAGQSKLPHRDLSETQIAAIMEPHRKYGVVPAQEAAKVRGFVGLCYDTRPISLERIRAGLAHTDEILAKEGEEIRKAAGVALMNTVEQQTGVKINDLEMEIVEENPDKHQGDGDPINQITVASNDPDPEAPIRRARQRRGGR